MTSENWPLGQGIPRPTKGAKESLLISDSVRYIGLSDEEAEAFSREPTAPFLIRERGPYDIPLLADRRDLPVSRRGGARRLAVVFRSGHQVRVDNPPGFLVLARAIRKALLFLNQAPQLGADAIQENSPCFFLFATRAASSIELIENWPVPPVVSEFMYIHAPGDYSIGHYGVHLFKHFDARALSMGEKYDLGLFQAMIDRKRRFEKSLLAGYTGPLVYPRHLIAGPSYRRRK